MGLKMYGKALLFVILVVVGAVLPYLLADEKFVGKLSGVLPGNATAPADDGTTNSTGVVTKPTTAGKPVTVSNPTPKRNYDSVYASQYGAKRDPQSRSAAIQPPVGNRNTIPDPTLFTQSGLPINTQQSAAIGTRLPRAETTSLVGPRGIPLEHLLSFNVTQRWISENWSRVSNRLAETNMQGWRVPVSLENPFDLIGSTTYYFDRQRNLQRITLHGFTTNPQPIVEMAQTRYRMQRIPSYQNELYVHGNAAGPLGGLRIGSTSVRKARGRSEVLLELNREGSPFGMSYEFEGELRTLQQEAQTIEPLPERPLFPEYETFQNASPKTPTTTRQSGFGWFGLGTQRQTQPAVRSLQRFVK